MARINIEDSLWGESRFMQLCAKLGDARTAIGAVILAWKTAQKFWCPDKKPVPIKDWVEAAIGKEMIEVGLARETNEGIYVCGSEQHFAWWFEKQASARAAGLASAEARKRKFGSAIPFKASNDHRTPPNTVFGENGENLSEPPNTTFGHVRSQPNTTFGETEDDDRRTPCSVSAEREPNDSFGHVRFPPNRTERSSSFSSSFSNIKSVVVEKDLLRAGEEKSRGDGEESFREPEGENLFRGDAIEKFLEGIPLKIQQVWLGAFGPDRVWVEAEIKKAASWWASNHKKRRIGDTVPSFVNRWLTKAKRDLEEYSQDNPYEVDDEERPSPRSVPLYQHPHVEVAAEIPKDARDFIRGGRLTEV